MTDNYAIVTGANGQIGNNLARKFLDSGKRLLLMVHNRQERLADLRNDDRVLILACDLRDDVATTDALTKANSHFGTTADVLIHLASLRSSDARAVSEAAPDVFRDVLQANVWPAFHILHACLPYMQQNGYGRIVMFASDVATHGLANGAAYAAAKAAIVNLAKSAALENAEYNILINTISPGPVETNLEEDYQGEYLEFRKQYFEQARRDSLTGKLVDMNELWLLVKMLTSHVLSNITGTDIMINGRTQ